jgi:HEAT repeat protein
MSERNRRRILPWLLLGTICAHLACGAQPSPSPERGSTSTSFPVRTAMPSATRTIAPSPTATDTPSPTPTPTPPPLQIPGWQGMSLHTLCLDIQQSFQEMDEGFSLPIEEFVQKHLSLMGIRVISNTTACEAKLTMALTGEPRGDTYAGTSIGYCYTGAMVRLHTILSVEGAESISIAITKIKPTPSVTYGCREKSEAPFSEVWIPAVSHSLFKLWGPSLWEACVGDDEWGEHAQGELSTIDAVASEVPILLENLKDPDWQKRTEALKSISEFGVYAQEAVPFLIDVLGDDTSEVREAAANALQEMLLSGAEAQQAIPFLINALSDDEFMVRLAAEETLGAIPEAIPALIQALKNDDEWIRAGAATALGYIGPEAREAIPDLILTLKDTSSLVRFNAAYALGQMGSEAKQAIPALIKTTNDSDKTVRQYAVQALGKIGPEPEVIPALIRALADPESSVRSEACDALRMMPEAVPALIEALRDQRPNVRSGAAEALAEITEQDFGEDASLWEAWWQGQGNQ